MILFWLFYSTFLIWPLPYKNYVGFWIDLKTQKSPFEINWPLKAKESESDFKVWRWISEKIKLLWIPRFGDKQKIVGNLMEQIVLLFWPKSGEQSIAPRSQPPWC